MSLKVLTKLAALVATDERIRKTIGWVVVAILSPVILVVAFLCSLASGTAQHNASVVELCFHGGEISQTYPAEYRAYIEEMRESFNLLDERITDTNGLVEGEPLLDAVRVKAMFYALFFGAEQPGTRATADFVDCFFTYEERTRTVITTDEDGNEVETEEVYMVAIPIQELAVVWENIYSALGVEVTAEIQSDADSVYNIVQYGWHGGGTGDWGAIDIGGPVLSVDGFCSPLGAGWRSMISSDFGWRFCPVHKKREFHSALDLAVPGGTSIRAALAGTVVKSYYSSSYGNYTVIDHGNGMTTAYAHQARRLVQVGDTVEVGEIIGYVGSTGNSTGPHLHFEVRVDGSVQDPKLYLP